MLSAGLLSAVLPSAPLPPVAGLSAVESAAGGSGVWSAAHAAPPVSKTGGRAKVPSRAASGKLENNVRKARMGLFFCLDGLDNLVRHGFDQVAQSFQHQVVGSAAGGQAGARLRSVERFTQDARLSVGKYVVCAQRC